MTLAEKLKNARTKRKLTMNQVESFSGKKALDHRGKVSQGYISRLESGKETNPSFLKLRTLCGLYGIKPGSLF